MGDSTTRREELIAAALAGELTASEEKEFAAASAADPSMGTDLAEMRAMTDRLEERGITWREEEPSAELDEWVRALASPGPRDPAGPRDHAGARDDAGPREGMARERRFRWPQLAAASVALVVVGAAGALGVRALIEAPPQGPPGTLGAVEQVEFANSPADTSIDGSLVAHTWGTETVLEVEGLDRGAVFDVVLIGRDGSELSSGTFLGTDVKIDCRMNVAVLREDVQAVQIQDEEGTVVSTATVPPVGG